MNFFLKNSIIIYIDSYKGAFKITLKHWLVNEKEAENMEVDANGGGKSGRQFIKLNKLHIRKKECQSII